MAPSMSSLISLVLLLPLLTSAAPAALSSEVNTSSAVKSVASIPVPSASGIGGSSAIVPSDIGSASIPLPSGGPSAIPSGVASESLPHPSGFPSSAIPTVGIPKSVPIPSGGPSSAIPTIGITESVPVPSGSAVLPSSHPILPSGTVPTSIPSSHPSECGHPPPHSSGFKPSAKPSGFPSHSGVPKPSGSPSALPSKQSGVPSLKPSGASSIPLPVPSGSIPLPVHSGSILPPVGSGKPSAVTSSATALKSNVASGLPSSAEAPISSSIPVQSSAPLPPVSSGVAGPSGPSSGTAIPSESASLPVIAPSAVSSAPVSAPSSTGNFTLDPGCTALTSAEVQALPGWKTLVAEAEKKWGKNYNVVCNDKDFPQNVAQKCAGKTGSEQVAKGWVWFQYFQTVQGHYKWALEMDALLPDEASRVVPGAK